MRHLRALFTFAFMAASPIWTLLALGQDNPITLSPSALSLNGAAGSTTLVRGTLMVTSSSPRSIRVSASVPSGAPAWLSVSPSGSLTTPQTLTVTASASSLTAATYSGTINIRYGEESTVRVPVTFTVAARTLNVSPTSLSFSATAGGSSPSSQSLSITASPNSTFTATVSGGSWLRVSPSTGTTPTTLRVSSIVTGLSAGTFTGTVTITGNGITRSVPVSFTVNPGATLNVSPASLSFAATAGGSSPASQSLSVSASRNTAFTASVSGAPWLRVSPSTGTTPATLTVSSVVSGLSAGTFSGTITVTGGGITRTVPVNLTVSPASTFNVSPGTLSFTATAGGTSPPSQTLSVSATPNAAFTASVSGAPWLRVSPATGTTPATLTVSSSVSGLAAGTFTGTITVTGNGLTTTVPVSFTVNPSSTFTVTPASLTFSATVGGTSPAAQTLSVSATPNTTFTASASGGSWLTVSPTTGTTPASIVVASSLTGLAAGTFTGTITVTGAGSSRSIPVTFSIGASGGSGAFALVGWNDLGMHCDDGKDFSIAGFLPPFNDLHAQLIDKSGALVTNSGGYTITYQAITDPLTNTLNTTSIGKTNFWDYVSLLDFYTMPVVNPVPDEGLEGNFMPGTSNTPKPMNYSTTDNTWQALAIPMINYADNGTTNYYPMMRITAKNSSGAVLATADIVLPISDEVSCGKCHASNSVAAAKPAAGWVNNPDPSKDMKLNLLRKHDDAFASTPLFKSAATQVGYNPAGLEATVATRPVLCYQCHSNAFTGMTGVAGISAFTSVIHGFHAGVIDPATGASMDSGTTRNTCYSCHPGPQTRCLRGAMGTLLTASGTNAIECQSCHGNMTALGNPNRVGWFDEPNCQSCHTGVASTTNTTLAYTSAFSSGTTLRTPADATFATTPNMPATGQSLFRLSVGHGGLQCEACHGSTHAEFPTNVVNDNVESMNLQGHSGMLVRVRLLPHHRAHHHHGRPARPASRRYVVGKPASKCRR